MNGPTLVQERKFYEMPAPVRPSFIELSFDRSKLDMLHNYCSDHATTPARAFEQAVEAFLPEATVRVHGFNRPFKQGPVCAVCGAHHYEDDAQ